MVRESESECECTGAEIEQGSPENDNATGGEGGREAEIVLPAQAHHSECVHNSCII